MARRLTARLLAIVITACGAPVPVCAEWYPEGNPVTQGAPYQYPVRAIPDGLGGAYVLCNGNDADGRNFALLQRVGADGQPSPGWPASGVVVMSGAGGGGGLASDGAGGAYVAWTATTGGYASGVYTDSCLVLRFDPSGVPHGSWPTAGLTVIRSRVTLPFGHDASLFLTGLVADSLGGCYVVGGIQYWQCHDTPCGFVMVSRVSPLGSSVSTQYLDFGCAGPSPSLALESDDAGGMIMSFATPCYPDRQLVVWPLTGPFQRISLGPSTGQTASMVRDHSSGVWVIGHPSPQADELRVQRISLLGAPVPGWENGVGMPISDYPANLQIVPDGSGGQLFMWTEATDPGTIRALRLLPDGTFSPPWNPRGEVISPAPAVVHLWPNSLWIAAMASAPDGAGGAYIAWLDQRNEATSGLDIFASRVLADGSLDSAYPTGGGAVCVSSPNHLPLRMVATEPGVAFVIWSDNRSGNWAVYAQRLPLDQTTPALVSLVRADASTGRVSLAWRVAEAATSITLQRRVEPGEWTELAVLSRDGLGEVAYEDLDVRDGARVGYRLALADGSETGEVWVTVPLAALSLAGFSPNPSVSTSQLAFTLADDSPAAIEVLDITGRRVFSRDLAGLGAGQHRLPVEARLAPGVYVIRLEQAGATRTARGVVTR